MMKRCPFCKRIVWFWQSKCYLDAKSKKPCHAYCWVWEMARLRNKSRAMSGMILRERINWPQPDDEIVELYEHLKDKYLKERKPFLYHRKDEVEKVEDDSWRKDVKK